MAKSAIATTQYQKFRGADFSTDPALVDRTRSPLCTNMVSDGGGMPEKRCGWETLHSFTENDAPVRINGLFTLKYQGTSYFYAHVGTSLYTWTMTDAAPVERLTGLHDGKSRATSLCGKLWIVTGGEYVVCEGNTVRRAAADDAYIPTTIITREPTGGGVPYENANLLNRYRKNAFQTDGESTVFRVDASSIDQSGDVRCWIWGTEVTEGFSVDRSEGTVTFETAPPAPYAGSADGLIIQFPATVAGYADRINRCTIITVYGAGSSDRVIVSGNPDFPNYDWTSGLNDPTYFPDLGYAAVGIDGVAIKGYCRIGSALAIIKEDNGQDSTVFFRTAAVTDGTVVFSLTQSMTGVGAVSEGGFATLLDEPLFVSGTGIYAATTNALTGDRVGQNRSYYVNSRLTAENLTDCEAVSWMGMYLLSVGNGAVYVLDGRQSKTYRSESLGDFVYECYYWEDVPARCWLNWEHGGAETLLFGTEDGRICRFKTDVATLDRFSDDGEPIKAVWATKMDDDGDPTIQKTMIKRGCAVTLKPYTRSSAKVCFRTDRDPSDYQTAAGTMDIFDWEDIDFSRFTFNANDGPQEIFFNSKVKKYKRLQILIRNDAANEGFGVFQITKHFVRGNFAKR